MTELFLTLRSSLFLPYFVAEKEPYGLVFAQKESIRLTSALKRIV